MGAPSGIRAVGGADEAGDMIPGTNKSRPAQTRLTRSLLLPLGARRGTPRREAWLTAAIEFFIHFVVPSAGVYWRAVAVGAAHPAWIVLACLPAWGLAFFLVHGRFTDGELARIAARLSLSYAGLPLILGAAAWEGGGILLLARAAWAAAGVLMIAEGLRFHARVDEPRIAARRLLESALTTGPVLDRIYPDAFAAEGAGRRVELTDAKRDEAYDHALNLFAGVQRDLLPMPGPGERIAVNATEAFRAASTPEESLERGILVGWIRSMSRGGKTEFDLFVRDPAVEPWDEERTAGLFPGLKVRVHWARNNPGLESAESDGRAGHPAGKLSARGARESLEKEQNRTLNSLSVYSLRGSDVAGNDPRVRAIGLESLVRVLKQLRRELDQARFIRENA